jgi:hypothetical protein
LYQHTYFGSWRIVHTDSLTACGPRRSIHLPSRLLAACHLSCTLKLVQSCVLADQLKSNEKCPRKFCRFADVPPPIPLIACFLICYHPSPRCGPANMISLSQMETGTWPFCRLELDHFDRVLEYRTQPTFVKDWRRVLGPRVLGGRPVPIRCRYPCVSDIDTYYAFLWPAFKASYSNRRKFEVKVTFCGSAYADISSKHST